MHKNNYPWLDWLRFLAAFLVLSSHARDLMFVKYADLASHGIGTAIFFTLTRMGNEAVLVFFVLSGFLVGGPGVESIINGTFDLKAYSIDRITRIFVPLVPAILLTGCMEIYLSQSFSWGQAVGNLFAMQGIFTTQLPGNEALWTLSYEIWFYILLGGFAAMVSQRPYIGGSIVLACILAFTQLFPHYLVCWLIGAAAYFYRPKQLSYKSLAFGLLICLYGYIGRQVGRGSDSVSLDMLSAWFPGEEMSRVVFSTGFAILVRQIILIRAFPRLEYIGTILASFSYTLYLMHFPVIRYFTYHLGITRLNTISPVLFCTVIVSCFVLALIMFLLFERNTKIVRNILRRL